MRVNKGSQAIYVCNILGAQLHSVAPVEGANIVLYVLCERGPVMLHGGALTIPVPSPRYLPAKTLGVCNTVAQDGSLMHKLFWNTPYVDTSSTQTPRRTLIAGCNKVQTGNLFA